MKKELLIRIAEDRIPFLQKDVLLNNDQIEIPIVHEPGLSIEPNSYLVHFRKVKKENGGFIWEFLKIDEFKG